MSFARDRIARIEGRKLEVAIEDVIDRCKQDRVSIDAIEDGPFFTRSDRQRVPVSW